MTRLLTFLCTVFLALSPAWASDREQISELLSRGKKLELIKVHPSIWVVSGNSNAYLVETSDGAVVIDTGLGPEAQQTFELLRSASDKPVRKLVITHAHADHIGGAHLWQTEGVETIAARAFPLRNRYYHELRPFQAARARVLWANVMPEGGEQRFPYPRVEVDVLVSGTHGFELGGIRFELLETPGGEGPDSVSIWIPAWEVLFSGDTLGPSTATFPNLFTLRGENYREAIPMIDTLERMIALEPGLLLPGHLDPLRGKAEIADPLRRTADALRYVHDATVAGMNQGKDVLTLMREIELPPEFEVSQQYGRVPWGVRAIWESYVGWFRYDSTTELYDVSVRSVYPELTALAGGPERLAERALAYVEAGNPLEALHLTEIALAADPTHRAALEVKLRCLQQLARADGGTNFQISGWLRSRIEATEGALAH